MSKAMTGRLIIIAGPSGVGKSPLYKALCKFYPEISASLQKVVLHTSRSPRPGEVNGIDYYFSNEEKLQDLRSNPAYLVTRVRGDLQALNIKQLMKDLKKGDVIFEGNTLIGRALQVHEELEEVRRLSVFISPLSTEEIKQFKKPGSGVQLPDLVREVLRRKLLRRTERQRGLVSLPDLQNIELRASEAWDELKLAHHFDWVLPNHDGEDSDHWETFYYPLGEARRTLQELVNLLKGKKAVHAERWKPGLLSGKY